MARTRSTKRTTQKQSEPRGPAVNDSSPEAPKADTTMSGGSVERETGMDASTNARQTMYPDEDASSRDEDARIHGRIAERAFSLYVDSGCKHGNDLEHWFEAEREIRT